MNGWVTEPNPSLSGLVTEQDIFPTTNGLVTEQDKNPSGSNQVTEQYINPSMSGHGEAVMANNAIELGTPRNPTRIKPKKLFEKTVQKKVLEK